MNKSDNQSIPDLNDNAAMVIVYLGLRTFSQVIPLAGFVLSLRKGS